MSNQTNSSGVSFASLLFLVFLVLKLTDVIQWSWWWITAPLWVGVAVVVISLSIVGVIAIIKIILDDIKRKQKSKKK